MKTTRQGIEMARQLLGAMAAAACLSLGTTPDARAAGACRDVATGLLAPGGLTLTAHGRLLVAESGVLGLPNSGRLSLVEPDGRRRTLIEGLPAGTADVGDVSGPAAVLMRGRTVYLAIGVGDVAVIGRAPSGQPLPGSSLPNPAGPSSPLFSSVLAIHLSAEAERSSKGFMLTAQDHARLAAGEKLALSNGGGDRIDVELVVDLPNTVAVPRPDLPGNIKSSNPFAMALVGDRLYITDGGRNLVWGVDLATRSFAPTVVFPPIPNPVFGSGPGGPVLEAVPTGIAALGDDLLVALFRGAPFPAGASAIHLADPATGTHASVVGGLKTAIGVEPDRTRGERSLLVLEHASIGLFFNGSGRLWRYGATGTPPTLLADCMTRPIAMAQSGRGGPIYMTQIDNRLVAVTPAP